MEATTRGWAAVVVADLVEARSVLGHRLAQAGFEVFYEEDGLAALDAIERCRPDVILMGGKLPGFEGVGFVRRIREISNVPIVMIAASASVSDCEEAMRAGANRYLEFARDLDRLASVACELVGEPPSASARATDRSITATEARLHAKRELGRELQGLLVECRGNIAEMARRMGKDRSTIRYHLRRLGMLDDEEPTRAGARSDVRPDARPEMSSELSRRFG